MSEFPGLYAGLTQSFRADLVFWRRLARAAEGPILELGSGTGRVAAQLARRGFTVSGIESDPEMISWAERHRPHLRTGSLSYLQGDISRFHLSLRFGLVICPCNTLSLLPRDQAQRALRKSLQHLLPDGVFAAELAHPREVRTGDPDSASPLSAFTDPVTGWPVQLTAVQHYRASRRASEIDWRFDRLLPDGQVVRREVRQTVHLWEAAEIERALRAAGFAGCSLLGGYTGKSYDEHSPRMLVVAVAP